ncbi:MAG: hypothetical protein IJX30_04410 [Clostridia bacterium]|nr:hypothetical protein [Clostridia bacterium]
MEPFGLFDLLKTLLPTAQNAENPPPDTPNATANDKPLQPPAPAAESERTNACLDFISRHDARAKHIKKN